jgi:AAA+ ATPase superfamily predicted ATPase
MAFYGRKNELTLFNKVLTKTGYQGILLWGRRHVGKSALIAEALKSFPGTIVYYQCVKSGDAINLQGLMAAYRLATSYPSTIHFSDIADFFAFVLEQEKGKKVAFVLDEYPYWREFSPLGKESLDSALQRAIDRVLRPSDAKLILSGSYLGAMEEIQKENNPLAGRLKNKISLNPLNYLEASSFYPHYSPLEKIKAYAVFGGMPYLLEELVPEQSVEENLHALYFSQEGSLRKLTPLLAEEELGKKDMLFRVFSLLCSRNDKPSLADLSSCLSDRSKEWVRQALIELMDMQLVERVYPIGEKDKERQAYYRVADMALRYYFRCVAPFENAILLQASSAVFQQAQDLFHASVLPECFERIASDYLALSNARRSSSPYVEIGTYFYHGKDHNGQFDIAAKNSQGYVFFECKLHSLTRADLEEERQQTENIPSYGIHPYRLGFFGLEKGELANEKNVLVFDGNDLYSL